MALRLKLQQHPQHADITGDMTEGVPLTHKGSVFASDEHKQQASPNPTQPQLLSDNKLQPWVLAVHRRQVTQAQEGGGAGLYYTTTTGGVASGYGWDSCPWVQSHNKLFKQE